MRCGINLFIITFHRRGQTFFGADTQAIHISAPRLEGELQCQLDHAMTALVCDGAEIAQCVG